MHFEHNYKSLPWNIISSVMAEYTLLFMCLSWVTIKRVTGDVMICLRINLSFLMFCNTCIRIVLLLFLYDWSSGHTKYPPGVLNVNVMQVNFGCKQERLAKLNPTTIVQDYVYPDNFPENLPRLKKYKLYELKQQIHNKQKLDEFICWMKWWFQILLAVQKW